jgi:hypothetical protein
MVVGIVSTAVFLLAGTSQPLVTHTSVVDKKSWEIPNNAINMNKAQSRFRLRVPGAALPFLVAMAWWFVPRGESAIIWNGPPLAFTNQSVSDIDRITPVVWLTRASTQGLFNIESESSYQHSYSPSNTEWAFGTLDNYASLSYTNWEDLFGGIAGGGPPALLGQDTVAHLISEDIYLSVKLTSWGGPGTGFSYLRSTPGVPPAISVVKAAPLGGGGAFVLNFTNIPGYNLTVLGTTNITLPLGSWNVLGTATYGPSGPGFYQFTDSGALTNQPKRFYLLRWP